MLLIGLKIKIWSYIHSVSTTISYHSYLLNIPHFISNSCHDIAREKQLSIHFTGKKIMRLKEIE